MQRLNRGMMERYEIEARRAVGVNCAQFGLDEALLGVAHRLLDGAAVGIAVCAGERDAGAAAAGEGRDPMALLAEQDGMYTVLIRGYVHEEPVKREQVVQAIERVAADDAALVELAAEPGLELALVDADSESLEFQLDRVARLLAARRDAGLGALTLICLGQTPDCAERVRGGIARRGEGLAALCECCPALAEGFAYRADAREAARQCEEMNYADGMIHLAEPFARLTVGLPEGHPARGLLSGAEGIVCVADIAPAMARKARLFDGALFAMAAPGWLLGLGSLSDCMKHEALRRFVGETCMSELLPEDTQARQADAPYVIECFERFENPLNPNGILRAARPLLRRFAVSVLPLMRAWAEERFEPPRNLSYALAATIMLYAGARMGASGRYEIARGRQLEALRDDPEALEVFSTLSHDMPPESLAYAVLADRELWGGQDLRDIDGLEARVTLDIARLQRSPGFVPGREDEP